ncbi:C40 family peptidase [uncultured Treponema sp.]|uniref:C40 family peptidase n=1 Tax=uncultured Treponema sp. TaxID=162155 RepID=UPI0025CCD3F6|nr:C40 family peptidase [uncultured Treponema sp.]
MSTRKAIFYTFAFFLFVLIVPQLCAQNEVSMSPSEAAIARQKLVEYSKKFIGKPYVSGGIGPNSFDCSGLIFTVSREAIGHQLPRTTKAIYNYCKEIDANTREAGDLVFFKTTTSGDISHVGLYIGNSQFIHAVSDGPNTGVIISSLKESYWKSHYFCTRRYLPASKSDLLADSDPKSYPERVIAKNNTNSTTNSGTKYVRSSNDSFLKSLVVDTSVSLDWSFFTPEYFRLNSRGFDFMVHARYAGQTIQPGFGTYFRYDYGTKNFQIPMVLSLTLNEFFRVFAGPVVSFGSPTLPGKSTYKIKNSFFPGIIGACFSTPDLKVGKTSLSLVQDIHYTVFNDTDGSALTFSKSIPAGLTFASGIRVTLPLKNVL